MEMADVVGVTKADGDLLGPARQAAADHKHALHLLRPKHEGWSPDVVLVSAPRGEGIAELWDAVERHRTLLAGSGQLDRRRADQARAWLWAEVRDQVLDRVYGDRAVRELVPEIEAAVTAGQLAPEAGARRILDAVERRT
jgi:LAO/AO transport system kinase